MAHKPKPQVDGSTPEAPAAVRTFVVLVPIKFSGTRYAVGDTIELTDDEYDDLPPGLIDRQEIRSETNQSEVGDGTEATPDKGSE